MGPDRNAWALVVWLVACGAPTVDTGDARLVTEGESPGTLSAPESPVGGIIEVARVRFAGSELSSSLVGDSDPFEADGLTLTVGTARFAYPRAMAPGASTYLLPVGPELNDGGTLRCVVELGRVEASVELPGATVDVGEHIRLQGSEANLRIELTRHPRRAGPDATEAISYRTLEAAQLPADDAERGNWMGGATLTVEVTGADIPRDRNLASVPVHAGLEGTVSLPLYLANVEVNGEPLELPPRDPLTGAPVGGVSSTPLPSLDGPLAVTWDAWSIPQDMLIVVEVFGPGDGHCPAGCGGATACCEDDAQCRSDEVCAPRAVDGQEMCVPRLGDGRDRLGALVCTAADIGAATLTAETLDGLRAWIRDSGRAGWVRSAVLKVARSWSGDVTLPDVMIEDGTRQSISPAVARTSDIVLTRLEVPETWKQE